MVPSATYYAATYYAATYYAATYYAATYYAGPLTSWGDEACRRRCASCAIRRLRPWTGPECLRRGRAPGEPDAWVCLRSDSPPLFVSEVDLGTTCL
jgi:hypothetical protein